LTNNETVPIRKLPWKKHTINQPLNIIYKMIYGLRFYKFFTPQFWIKENTSGSMIW